MKSIEEFLSGLPHSQRSSSPEFTTHHPRVRSILPDTVRHAATRGWQIFPVSRFAKLNGNPALLIAEASSDLSRLEKFAAEYPMCDWRVALGSSSLCVFEIRDPQCRYAVAGLSQEEGDSFTLKVQRGNTLSAFFTWPEGLVLRTSARKLIIGASILGPGDSSVIPPSGDSHYINPWAEVETIPHWLRELAFENPDRPPENLVPRPSQGPCPVPCRSPRPLKMPPCSDGKGYPGQNQAGLRKGFRIHRRL